MSAHTLTKHLSPQHSAADLEQLFHDCFFEDHNIHLAGGFSEPLYRPSDGDEQGGRLQYREDYYSSALHEVAHWCIAGEERRQLIDFGYWYVPDGRNPVQQAAFERAEVKPQALEWIFSVAAGHTFSISMDNLDVEETASSSDFPHAVYRQVFSYLSDTYRDNNLPRRAESFAIALAKFFGQSSPFDASKYDLAHLS